MLSRQALPASPFSLWLSTERVPPGRVDGSAKLPPLTEGECRHVREGAEGPHIGHFWVDERSRTGPWLQEVPVDLVA
jgi:hypothetical protein